MSVAWVLGDLQSQLGRAIRDTFPRNNNIQTAGVAGEGLTWRIEVGQVDCKIGKKMYSVAELKKR